MRIIRTVRNRVEVVIAVLGDRPLADLAGALRGIRGARIGVSPVVDGLAQLSRALRLAEIAALTCTKDGEVACLDARLSAGLLVSAPDVARELAGTVLRPVLGLHAVERDLLLTTLAAWLECDGSTRHAAARLYCHRNTVANRLRRLEHLAQRSLARPRDLVELTLALDALQLGRPYCARARLTSDGAAAQA
jgi:DNA-binding PucR family transcriptional regulator